jgi:hypothetical protein
MSAVEREALLKELEAITLTIPNTCGCCPPGGIANHDCNWFFINHMNTVQKVFRDPLFVGQAEASCCKHIKELITYAKKRASPSGKK